MPPELQAVFDTLLAMLAVVTDFLAVRQPILNLLLAFSTVCLFAISIGTYAFAHALHARLDRLAERRAATAAKFNEPRMSEPEGERPPLRGPRPAPEGQPNEVGNRLSRIENSFLQLNKDLMRLDEFAIGLKQDIATVADRLAQMRSDEARPLAPEPAPRETRAPGTQLEPVLALPVEVLDISATARSGDLVPAARLGAIAEDLALTSKKVDELFTQVESQRRTIFAIGQVLSQLPDWRRFKLAVGESLEHLIGPGEGRTGTDS